MCVCEGHLWTKGLNHYEKDVIEHLPSYLWDLLGPLVPLLHRYFLCSILVFYLCNLKLKGVLIGLHVSCHWKSPCNVIHSLGAPIHSGLRWLAQENLPCQGTTITAAVLETLCQFSIGMTHLPAVFWYWGH